MTLARVAIACSLVSCGAWAAACGGGDGGGASAVADGGADGSTSVATDAGGFATPDAGDGAAASVDCAAENAVLGRPPDHLECTGLFADFASKTIATTAREYKPAEVFWSDGADKTRWVTLPPGAKIDTSNMDEWSFPEGTKLWKEFRLGGKRIETRYFAKTGPSEPCDAVACATWEFTTYRWSDDESRAVRLTGGETNVNGTRYEIPAESRCGDCHAGRQDQILGFEAVNLGLPGATGVTLATLHAEGRLTNAPSTDALAIPNDATGKASAALAWMHVNCGTACHNANDNAGALFTGLFLRLHVADVAPADGGAPRVQDLDAYKTSVNQPEHALNGFNNEGYLLIKPGDPTHSLIPTLAGTRDVAGIEPMPPLASHVADDAGVGAINAWIAAMGDGGG